jgi:hypothetical protein
MVAIDVLNVNFHSLSLEVRLRWTFPDIYMELLVVSSFVIVDLMNKISYIIFIIYIRIKFANGHKTERHVYIKQLQFCFLIFYRIISLKINMFLEDLLIYTISER